MAFQESAISAMAASARRDSRSLVINVNGTSNEQQQRQSPMRASNHVIVRTAQSGASNHLTSAEQKILKAIKHNDLVTVTRLLESPDLFSLNVNFNKLLFACCEYDRKDILRKLVKFDSNVNQTNEDSITCLMTAARKNHYECILVLLSNGAKVNLVDNYEWTALMYASYYGHVESVKLLLDAGAFVNVFDMDHLSSLIWASGRGHLEVVRLLLKFGAKVDACDKYGTTPLIWACRKGHNEVVECLLQAGANVNATGMFGWSALLTTVRGNYLETTKILLRHECVNVNTCDSQRLSPLMIASKDGLVDIAKLLIEKDAFVNLSDRYGHTALIHATKSGHVEIVEVLIKAKADIDHIGFDKKSATFWSVEKGYIEVTRALLKMNPNLEIITNEGETCLIRAVKLRRYDIISLLLNHGAKVSATDKYGDTVLHTAVRMQSKTIVELLLTNPKNCQLIYKPNKRKETPFSIDQNNPRPIFPSLFDDFENKKASLFSSRPFDTIDNNHHQRQQLQPSGADDRGMNHDLMGKMTTPLQCINLISHNTAGPRDLENEPPQLDAFCKRSSCSGTIESSPELGGGDGGDRHRQPKGGLSERNSQSNPVN
uniref:Kinase D-interacting substrate n=1 Tax=Aceria tosichella TaxID=561515 RepID=A0A6G1S7Z7_9ACAR